MPRSPRLPLPLVVVLGLSASLAVAAYAADWPQWRGPQRDNLSPATGLLTQWPAAGPPLLFKASGLGGGYSSLALAGDRIFTLGDRADGQHLLALGRKDGKVLWSTRIGPVWEDEYGGPRSTPTVDGDRVYALGTDGDLVAAEAATGKVVWRKNLEKDFGGRVMTI
jgi:outer membrane protein assembly factor BamB